MQHIRPRTGIQPVEAFRVELQVRVMKTGEDDAFVWVPMPGPDGSLEFAGQCLECALAYAVEMAAEELRRIAKRPPYRLQDMLGASWGIENVRFVRVQPGVVI